MNNLVLFVAGAVLIVGIGFSLVRGSKEVLDDMGLSKRDADDSDAPLGIG